MTQELAGSQDQQLTTNIKLLNCSGAVDTGLRTLNLTRSRWVVSARVIFPGAPYYSAVDYSDSGRNAHFASSAGRSDASYALVIFAHVMDVNPAEKFTASFLKTIVSTLCLQSFKVQRRSLNEAGRARSSYMLGLKNLVSVPVRKVSFLFLLLTAVLLQACGGGSLQLRLRFVDHRIAHFRFRKRKRQSDIHCDRTRFQRSNRDCPDFHLGEQ